MSFISNPLKFSDSLFYYVLSWYRLHFVKNKMPPLNCRSIFSPFTKEILTFILYIHPSCCQYDFYIGNFLISFIGTELFPEKARYAALRLLTANKKKFAVFYLFFTPVSPVLHKPIPPYLKTGTAVLPVPVFTCTFIF